MITKLSKELFCVCSKISNVANLEWRGPNRNDYADGVLVHWFMDSRKRSLVARNDEGLENCSDEVVEYYNEHFTQEEAGLLKRYLVQHLRCSSTITPAKVFSSEFEDQDYIPLGKSPCSTLFGSGMVDFYYDLTQEPTYSLPFTVCGHYTNSGEWRSAAPADLIVKHRPNRSDLKCGCCGRPMTFHFEFQLFYSHPFSETPICDECAEKHFPEKHANVKFFNNYPWRRREFGVCPHCSNCDGRLFDGESVWAFCCGDKLKWPVSDGHIVLKSDDKDSLVCAFGNLLSDFQIVEPVLEKAQGADRGEAG
jgi:hypothetical protein